MAPKKDGIKQSTLDKYRQTGGRNTPPQTPENKEDESAPKDSVRSMFAELQRGIGQINEKLDAQGTCLTGLQTAVDSLKTKTQQTEQRLGDTETTVADLTARLHVVETCMVDMKNKQDDLEARSRRNNVRILGLDESHTAKPLEPLMETIIRDLLGAEGLSPMFVVERAHRTPTAKPLAGAPPRPIIMRLLNYRDRDAILRLAREKGDLRYQGSKISIYPDFTLAVQNARRAFLDVKDALRNNGVLYSMMYPAKLRVVYNGKTLFFDNPTAAETFVLDTFGELRRRPPRTSRANIRRRGRGEVGTVTPSNMADEDGLPEATGGS